MRRKVMYMKVNTRLFGEIDVQDDKIINIDKGIIGFPDLKSFTLVFDSEKDDKNIMWFQSLDEPAFAMPVISPNNIIEDYNPTIEDSLLQPLGELTPDNTYVLVTVKVPRDITQMTINLKAPIIINTDTLIGGQIIVEDDVEVRFPVYDLIKKGDNTFSLDKTKATTNVCPSTLIYLFNTTGSSVRKNVYISNGADLLSSDEISALKQVKSDSLINADLNNVNDATLYVFATNAQKGEGNIIFNGKEFADVWNGKTLTSEIYSVNVKDNIKAANSISFVSTDSTILSLQKILVTSMPKIKTSISANNVNIFYLSGKQLILTLKDNKGNVLSKKHVSIKLNGKTFDRTTDSNGKAKLTISLAPKTYSASITFAGDGMYVGSTSKVNVVVKKATPKIVASKKTFKVKTKTKKYTIAFKTNTGKPMKKVKVTLKVKGKTYKATTTAKGKATFKITKLTKKGKFTATIRYSGNKYYKAVSKYVKITVKK